MPGTRAVSGPGVHLAASFSPERLGAATAITFALKIDPPGEAAPPPLSQVDFSYPANLGFATSGLGLASCEPGRLQAEGSVACPADSRMGAGSATVEVPFGPVLVEEHVGLELFAAPSSDGYLHLAILALGSEPVIATVVITGVLLEGHLQINVPVIPGLPDGPDISIKQISATLGGALTYYERVNGRRVAYRPRGIGLPDSCPHGGWRLGAKLSFQDGGRAEAGTAVACPARRSRAHRAGPGRGG
jgi:hypothetical protein